LPRGYAQYDGCLCRLGRSPVTALASADSQREVVSSLLRLPCLTPSRRILCTNQVPNQRVPLFQNARPRALLPVGSSRHRRPTRAGSGPGLLGFAWTDGDRMNLLPTSATTIWKLVPSILELEVPAGGMEACQRVLSYTPGLPYIPAVPASGGRPPLGDDVVNAGPDQPEAQDQGHDDDDLVGVGVDPVPSPGQELLRWLGRNPA
jgi:hypothetical protein